MPVFRTLHARYRIEPDFRIGWTSANWDRFARENGAEELADGRVVGRPIWDFIEGDETRAIYADLIDRVKQTGEEIVLPFRCDSPDVRRFMELRMKRPFDARVELVAELLREETRPYVGLLDVERPRAGAPVDICSFCKRVAIRERGWIEAEDAVSALGLDEDSPLPPLQHRVCPDCRRISRAHEPETHH